MILRSCQIPLLLSVTFILVGCGGSKNSPAYNPDVGPFDEDGNYIEAWADNPPKRGERSSRPEPKPDPKPQPRVVDLPQPKPVAKPRPVTTARVTPKPKPRPVVKPKPKRKPVVVKPKTIRHTVKDGETLYGLARKYGTSVSAIQKINGLKGTLIRTGKSYVIPR